MISPPQDLTRWNRASLSRFRYIDGNAVTFLEDIRSQLQSAFPTWEHVNPVISPHETWEETKQRLEEQYFGPRQEWAWEIARSFVRAVHILTEHIDAFSNEGYLRTATQWEYLRRLLDMLDYRPRPPSSAISLMALIARTDISPVHIDKGLQVSVTPDDGRPRLVFESLDTFELDPALNGLRLSAYNFNPEPLAALDDDIWPLPKKHKVSIGQTGVLVQGDTAFAVQIRKKNGNFISVKDVDDSDAARPDYVTGACQLLVEPEDIQSCALNGTQTYRMLGAERYSPGQVIALTTSGFPPEETTVNTTAAYDIVVYDLDVRETVTALNYLYGEASTDVDNSNAQGPSSPTSAPYAFAEIAAVDRFGIKLGKIVSDHMQSREFKRILSHKIVTPYLGLPQSPDLPDLPEEVGALVMFNPPAEDNLVVAAGFAVGGLVEYIGNAELDGDVTVPLVKNTQRFDRLFYFDKSNSAIETVAQIKLDDALDQLILEGSPGNIQTGDYMVLESSSGKKNARKVLTVIVHEDSFAIHFYSAPELNDVARLYGPYKHELRPVDHDRDPTPVTGGSIKLDLDTSQMPSSLVRGKTVIIEPEDDKVPHSEPTLSDEMTTPLAAAFLTKISDIVIEDDGGVSISLDAPATAYLGFTRGNFIIRGNCSLFGHGESQHPIILGSGDPSKNNQKFLVKRDNISFVFDSSLEWGVRADIEVVIDERRYHQVSTFRNSKPGDAHYTITLVENGFIEVCFGDGVNGRRLPSGYNNVQMGFRVGSGSHGNNVARGALNSLVKSDVRTVEVRQPLGTSGGEDRESASQIRENAPRHLRTLERAISLSDFEYIARSTAGVWQAKAAQPSHALGRKNLINITIVPAHNAPLDLISDAIKSRLEAVSPPSMVFNIEKYDPVILSLSVIIRIDALNFDARTVEKTLRERLFESLTLAQRLPGQRLFVSELYKIIENHSGVMNSDVNLFSSNLDPIGGESGTAVKRVSRDSSGMISVITPLDNQVIYVESPSAIGIMVQTVVS